MTDPLAALGHFIVDAGVGFVAEKTLEPAFEQVWRVVKAVLLPQWDPALSAVRLNLQEHVDRERAKDAAFREKLERSLQGGEGAALIALFVREAAQATTEERMRMLAAAAAGVFVPDLESEMRSRVARAVARLEPSDVIALRIALVSPPFRGTNKVGGEMSTAIPPDRVYEGLLVSGCIADANVMGGGVYITALGHAVAKSLASWHPLGT